MSTHSGGFDVSAENPAIAREDEGQVVHLRDEEEEPIYWTDGEGKQKPLTVTMAGTYSARFRRAEESQRQRNLKRRRAQITADALKQDRLELVAACVLAWDGMAFGGTPVPCTPDNALKVVQAMDKKRPHLLLQMELAMEDHAGFFKTS